MGNTEKQRVLIADDNETNIELIEDCLADADLETAIALDGQDTLDKVASFRPDLILLNMLLPKLSGFEVCERLRGNPVSKGIMILVIVASNGLGEIERVVKSGADDLLFEPLNKVELIRRVDILLRLARLQRD